MNYISPESPSLPFKSFTFNIESDKTRQQYKIHYIYINFNKIMFSGEIFRLLKISLEYLSVQLDCLFCEYCWSKK